MSARPRGWPAAVVMALWLPYAALNTVFPGPLATYLLGLVPAGAAVTVLVGAGVRRRDLGLRLAWPSAGGAAALGLLALVIPMTLVLGRGQPWRPLDDLVYAPLSAVGQEVYFRVALLTALRRLCHGHSGRAVTLQALLFALWHARAFRVAPPGLAALALAGTFVGGLVWGWQAQRDRTVIYAVVEHTLFLAVQ